MTQKSANKPGNEKPSFFIQHEYTVTKGRSLKPAKFRLLAFHEGEVYEVAKISEAKARELVEKLGLGIGD